VVPPPAPLPTPLQPLLPTTNPELISNRPGAGANEPSPDAALQLPSPSPEIMLPQELMQTPAPAFPPVSPTEVQQALNSSIVSSSFCSFSSSSSIKEGSLLYFPVLVHCTLFKQQCD
jgi:hypothetical protein